RRPDLVARPAPPPAPLAKKLAPAVLLLPPWNDPARTPRPEPAPIAVLELAFDGVVGLAPGARELERWIEENVLLEVRSPRAAPIVADAFVRQRKYRAIAERWLLSRPL